MLRTFGSQLDRPGSARQARRRSLQVESLESRQLLAVFHVVADVGDGEAGSLRAAIIAANQNLEDDIIELTAGNYELTLPRVDEPNACDKICATVLNPIGGDLDLTERGKQITIRGEGATTTIIDVSRINDRAFDIAAGVDAVFEGITIQGGSNVEWGGGIAAGADVEERVRVNYLQDGAHEAWGSLTIRDSVLRDNRAEYSGGGVINYGQLTIERSHFLDNYSGNEGGAIDLPGGGDALIIASSFIGNEARRDGAGIHVGFVSSPVGAQNVSIVNSTIARNHAGLEGGGIQVARAFVTIMNSTLSENSAVRADSIKSTRRSTVRLDHTTVINGDSTTYGTWGYIYATNSIIVGHSVQDVGLFFTSEGNNLIGLVGENGFAGDENFNIVGVDPHLGPLADNGGPTLTHALQPDSPAIDMGNPGMIDVRDHDQRGALFDGESGNRVDIGAFEYQTAVINYNEDDRLDCSDADAMVAAIIEGNHPLQFDLTADNFVDEHDLQVWLSLAGNENLPSHAAYLPGDANLDGKVDAGDLNALAVHWQQPNAGWCGGDINLDGNVAADDLNQLAMRWLQDVSEREQVAELPALRRPAAAAIPPAGQRAEPASATESAFVGVTQHRYLSQASASEGSFRLRDLLARRSLLTQPALARTRPNDLAGDSRDGVFATLDFSIGSHLPRFDAEPAQVDEDLRHSDAGQYAV